MKCLAVIAILTLAVVGEALLVGDKECTYGPSYWCESIQNAKQCVAVKHCIQTVWEKQNLPKDNDDVCAICKNMVQEARNQLLSNETQTEIREVFEGSCKLIPITLIQDECIKLSDEFIPQLIDTLASQMNPQVVCATAGLCNSARVDRLIRQYKEEHGDVSFAPSPKATPKATPLPGECTDCKTFITDVVDTVRRHSRAELLDHLLAICGRLSSLSDGCMALVQSNFDVIHDFLTHEVRPDDVCTLFGMCNGLFGDVTVSLSKTGDEPCDFCVAIVGSWRNNLIANTTKEEFKMILDGICHQMGKFEKECSSLVDQYFETIYDILVSEVHPKEICEAVGLCGVSSIFRNDVPLWPLLPVEVKDRLPLVPLRPSFDKNELIGQDEANAYHYEHDHLPRVHLSRLSINVVSMGEKGVLLDTPPQKKSDTCVMCEFTLHFLQNVLNDKKTRDEIEEAVESVCQYLPHTVSEECEDYIEAYGDQVIQLIILEMDPASICPMLNLCPGERAFITFKRAPTCVLCEYVMTELDQILADKSNEESIKEAVENVCGLLPKTVRTDCVTFVDQYIDQIVNLIVNDVTPDQVCEMLGLCHEGGPLALPDPANAQLPISRLFSPALMVNNDLVKDKASNSVISQSAECVICEFILGKIESLLLKNATETEIKDAFEKVCVLMPSTLMNDCLSFLDQYGDSLIELIVNNIDPPFVCRKIKLCGDNFVFGLPRATVQLPVNDCLMCERLMDHVAAQEPGFTGSSVQVHMLLSEGCRHLPTASEKKCFQLVTNYGKYLGKLLEELSSGKRTCQALKMCPFHGRHGLLGEKKCIQGPDYWCQSKLHAEACKATELCINKVWSQEGPSA